MARIRGAERARSLLARIAYGKSRRRYGRILGPLRVYALSDPVLWGCGQMELALERCRAAPDRISALAQLRVAMRVGCPF